MINSKSIAVVDRTRLDDHFVKPLYESYCFSNIPSALNSLFFPEKKSKLPADVLQGAEPPYDSVVLFLVDGFGWHFYEQFAEHCSFLNDALLSKLTAQFPSTTAAEITTLNCDLPCGETGVYEWFYYEPSVDAMICPLMYSFAGDREVDSLKETMISPETLYPKKTFYHTLADQDVSSYVFLGDNIVDSVYTNATMEGATKVGYANLEQGLQNLLSLVKKNQGKRSYYYFYIPSIDSVGHRKGIEGEQFKKEVKHCFSAIENEFWKEASQLKKTACILTADHGMSRVNPKTTIYLNKEFPDILPSLRTNKKGELMIPAGSCRDFFLHVKDDALPTVKNRLIEGLSGKADVIETEELINRHFFGSAAPSQRFLDRVGNLIVLPYEGESLWWYDPPKFSQHFLAAHGGLTPKEMEIPFFFYQTPA